MNKFNATPFHRKATALFIAAFALTGTVEVSAQTVFTVNNVGPILSTGAVVSMFDTSAVFQNAGPVSNNITAVTFGTDLDFYSPGPSFGASNPGFNFNGAITGSSITAGTTMPISYSFTLGKNASAGDTVGWTLTFSDNLNATPMVIGTGSLFAVNSNATANFSGGSAYSFTNGSSSSFTASLALTYTTGQAMANPDVTISMANSGFGGQGITLNVSAIPEPSTYAAIMGAALLGLAFWRRRRQPAATVVG